MSSIDLDAMPTPRCRRSELLGTEPLSDQRLESARGVVAQARHRFLLAVESTSSVVVLDGWLHDNGSGVVQARVPDDASVPVGVTADGDFIGLLSAVWSSAVGEIPMWSTAEPIEVAGSQGLAGGVAGCRQLVLLTSNSPEVATRRLVVAVTDQGCLTATPSTLDEIFVLEAASAVKVWSLVTALLLSDVSIGAE